MILFELLTGHVVYESTQRVTPFELAARHVNEAPPLPSSRNPELSAAIDAVVVRSLAKSPEMRPPSAVDLAREFEAAVAEFRDSAPVTSSLKSEVRTTAPTNVAARVTSVVTPPPGPAIVPETAPEVAVPSAGHALRWTVIAGLSLLLVVMVVATGIVGWRQGWFVTTPAPTPGARARAASRAFETGRADH